MQGYAILGNSMSRPVQALIPPDVNFSFVKPPRADGTPWSSIQAAFAYLVTLEANLRLDAQYGCVLLADVIGIEARCREVRVRLFSDNPDLALTGAIEQTNVRMQSTWPSIDRFKAALEDSSEQRPDIPRPPPPPRRHSDPTRRNRAKHRRRFGVTSCKDSAKPRTATISTQTKVSLNVDEPVPVTGSATEDTSHSPPNSRGCFQCDHSQYSGASPLRRIQTTHFALHASGGAITSTPAIPAPRTLRNPHRPASHATHRTKTGVRGNLRRLRSFPARRSFSAPAYLAGCPTGRKRPRADGALDMRARPTLGLSQGRATPHWSHSDGKLAHTRPHLLPTARFEDAHETVPAAAFPKNGSTTHPAHSRIEQQGAYTGTAAWTPGPDRKRNPEALRERVAAGSQPQGDQFPPLIPP